MIKGIYKSAAVGIENFVGGHIYVTAVGLYTCGDHYFLVGICYAFGTVSEIHTVNKMIFLYDIACFYGRIYLLVHIGVVSCLSLVDDIYQSVGGRKSYLLKIGLKSLIAVKHFHVIIAALLYEGEGRGVFPYKAVIAVLSLDKVAVIEGIGAEEVYLTDIVPVVMLVRVLYLEPRIGEVLYIQVAVHRL